MALEKVLVVDDDPNICDVLRMYLENEGYSVILAYDGEEALVKFNALKPDIILLDVMLPTLDGWQVCREVRKKSSVPIIMITAKGDTFDKVLGLELGADDYIVKRHQGSYRTYQGNCKTCGQFSGGIRSQGSSL